MDPISAESDLPVRQKNRWSLANAVASVTTSSGDMSGSFTKTVSFVSPFTVPVATPTAQVCKIHVYIAKSSIYLYDLRPLPVY